MSEREGKDKEIMEQFAQLPVGNVMPVPVDLLRPTQPDDGKASLSTRPVEGSLSPGGASINVIHGNHRVHSMINRGPGVRRLPVRKVPDPHEEHIKG